MKVFRKNDKTLKWAKQQQQNAIDSKENVWKTNATTIQRLSLNVNHSNGFFVDFY